MSPINPSGYVLRKIRFSENQVAQPLFSCFPSCLLASNKLCQTPMPAAREKTCPRLFLVRVCIDGSRKAAKTQAVSCTPPSTLAFMNYVLPVADMWDI